MRHKRGTHTQFNEVFTDNSNCQILARNDIVQSAGRSQLPCSLQLSPSSLSQADLISGKNLLGGKEAAGAASEGHGFYQKENNPLCCRSQLKGQTLRSRERHKEIMLLSLIDAICSENQTLCTLRWTFSSSTRIDSLSISFEGKSRRVLNVKELPA